MKLTFPLSTGLLTLDDVKAVNSGWRVDDLFSVAERENPKRPFLFVSHVLGRHIPVQPSALKSVALSLVEQLPDNIPGPVLVVGFAETATGFGAVIAENLMGKRDDVDYRHSTRHPNDEPLWCSFSEPHSHATEHSLHYPERAPSDYKTVILVDDEMTTGTTNVNLLSALKQAGMSGIERCLCITLKDWSCGKELSSGDTKIERFCLLSGQWSFVKSEDVQHAYEIPKPSVEPVRQPITWDYPSGKSSFLIPKFDLTALTSRWGHGSNEKILVLGCGEHTYWPYSLALALEQFSDRVYFSAMSRSPILEGKAIQSKVAGVSPYDQATPFYLYNVVHQQWDRVIVCLETSAADFPNEFKQALNACSPIVEYITDDTI